MSLETFKSSNLVKIFCLEIVTNPIIFILDNMSKMNSLFLGYHHDAQYPMKSIQEIFPPVYVQCLTIYDRYIVLRSRSSSNILNVKILDERVQNVSQKMNLKNKYNYKLFEIYKIHFNYCRFSKIFIKD